MADNETSRSERSREASKRSWARAHRLCKLSGIEDPNNARKFLSKRDNKHALDPENRLRTSGLVEAFKEWYNGSEGHGTRSGACVSSLDVEALLRVRELADEYGGLDNLAEMIELLRRLRE